jgi:hypothetical protein
MFQVMRELQRPRQVSLGPLLCRTDQRRNALVQLQAAAANLKKTGLIRPREQVTFALPKLGAGIRASTSNEVLFTAARLLAACFRAAIARQFWRVSGSGMSALGTAAQLG